MAKFFTTIVFIKRGAKVTHITWLTTPSPCFFFSTPPSPPPSSDLLKYGDDDEDHHDTTVNQMLVPRSHQEDATLILNNLLKEYDKTLRPDIGSKIGLYSFVLRLSNSPKKLSGVQCHWGCRRCWLLLVGGGAVHGSETSDAAALDGGCCPPWEL